MFVLDLALARDPRTPAPALAELCRGTEPAQVHIRAAVAAHPNTPRDVLPSLMTSLEAFLAATSEPLVTPGRLVELATQLPMPDLLSYVQTDLGAPADVVAHLADRDTPDRGARALTRGPVALAIAVHPRSTVELQLRALRRVVTCGSRQRTDVVDRLVRAAAGHGPHLRELADTAARTAGARAGRDRQLASRLRALDLQYREGLDPQAELDRALVARSIGAPYHWPTSIRLARSCVVARAALDATDPGTSDGRAARMAIWQRPELTGTPEWREAAIAVWPRLHLDHLGRHDHLPQDLTADEVGDLARQLSAPRSLVRLVRGARDADSVRAVWDAARSMAESDRELQVALMAHPHCPTDVRDAIPAPGPASHARATNALLLTALHALPRTDGVDAVPVAALRWATGQAWLAAVGAALGARPMGAGVVTALRSLVGGFTGTLGELLDTGVAVAR